MSRKRPWSTRSRRQRNVYGDVMSTTEELENDMGGFVVPPREKGSKRPLTFKSIDRFLDDHPGFHPSLLPVGHLELFRDPAFPSAKFWPGDSVARRCWRLYARSEVRRDDYRTWLRRYHRKACAILGISAASAVGPLEPERWPGDAFRRRNPKVRITDPDGPIARRLRHNMEFMREHGYATACVYDTASVESYQ